MPSHRIQLKRVQDPPAAEDGRRVLVDRLWPRGIRKVDAALDDWAKALAPSSELRRWFSHDPARWQGFRERYRQELAQQPEALQDLLWHCQQGPVTLLFAARDRSHNQAVALREVLQEELEAAERPNESASPVCFASNFQPPGTSKPCR